MSPALACYLRTFRKRAGLTQADVAHLLGLTGQSVAKFEAMHRKPSLQVALACAFVFEAPLSALFPGEVHQVEELVIQRARLLIDQFEAELPPTRGQLRLAAVQAIVERTAQRAKTNL